MTTPVPISPPVSTHDTAALLRRYYVDRAEVFVGSVLQARAEANDKAGAEAWGRVLRALQMPSAANVATAGSTHGGVTTPAAEAIAPLNVVPITRRLFSRDDRAA